MLNSKWHISVSEQVLVSLGNVIPAGCNVADAFTGDYVLNLFKQTPEQCRWELEFPSMCSLSRVELLVAQQSNGRFAVEVKMEGVTEGPAWSVKNITDFDSLLSLSMDGVKRSQVIAGARWPENIDIEPITASVAQESFYIPVTPAPEMNPMMMGANLGSSSGGGNCPTVTRVDVIENANKNSSTEFSTTQNKSGKTKLKAVLNSGLCSEITWESNAGTSCEKGIIKQTGCDVEIDIDVVKTVCLEIKCTSTGISLWEGMLDITAKTTSPCPTGGGGAGAGGGNTSGCGSCCGTTGCGCNSDSATPLVQPVNNSVLNFGNQNASVVSGSCTPSVSELKRIHQLSRHSVAI